MLKIYNFDTNLLGYFSLQNCYTSVGWFSPLRHAILWPPDRKSRGHGAPFGWSPEAGCQSPPRARAPAVQVQNTRTYVCGWSVYARVQFQRNARTYYIRPSHMYICIFLKFVNNLWNNLMTFVNNLTYISLISGIHRNNLYF
jgi:hypothetical protein